MTTTSQSNVDIRYVYSYKKGHIVMISFRACVYTPETEAPGTLVLEGAPAPLYSYTFTSACKETANVIPANAIVSTDGSISVRYGQAGNLYHFNCMYLC